MIKKVVKALVNLPYVKYLYGPWAIVWWVGIMGQPNAKKKVI